jgi:polyisoprenoid-binding protein YceI
MRHVLATLVLTALLAGTGCDSGGGRPKSATPPGGDGGSSPRSGPTAPGKAGDTPRSAAPDAGPGEITPENTQVRWVGTKKDGKHEGGFTRFKGSISPASADLAAARISLEIDTDSLTSDNPMLTNHLKSPDFFDVKKFPKATFTSTAIKAEAKDGNTHVITGALTLHGTTKPITFPAKVAVSGDALTIDSTFTFDRTEHGITYAPDKVDKTVTVTVSSKVRLK